MSDASHELRSPIATIRQHAEVALAHPGLDPHRELAAVVLEADRRLAALVDDLLLLARTDELSAGTRVPVDLDDVVFRELAHVLPATATSMSMGGSSPRDVSWATIDS